MQKAKRKKHRRTDPRVLTRAVRWYIAGRGIAQLARTVERYGVPFERLRKTIKAGRRRT